MCRLEESIESRIQADSDKRSLKKEALAGLVLRNATKKFSGRFDLSSEEEPDGLNPEQSFNNEGFEIAPKLDEIEEMDEKEFEPHSGLTNIKAKDVKKLNNYKNLLFAKQASKFDKMANARNLRDCKKYEYFILLPDESITIIWNGWMLFVSFMFYIFNPYRLAFAEWDDPGWIAVDAIWDLFFLIDIVLTFFKAYYNKKLNLVDERKELAKRYISGWLIFDILSILPLYFIFGIRDYWTLIRHFKMIELHKMMKFNKYLKFLKRRVKVIGLFCRNLNFSVEMERLLGLVITFFLTCHLIACIWILFAEVGEDGFESWIDSYNLRTRSNFQLYVISYYFVITTFSTVGYGDFSPQTSYERIFVMFLEIAGIIFFSFAIGSLTTIISKFNSYNENLTEKLDTLEGLKRECDLGPGIYDMSRQYLVYQEEKDRTEALDLISNLPPKLSIEISAQVLKARLDNIKFFADKPKDFLAYVVPLIQPGFTKDGYYVFKEGDTARYIYFLLEGKAGYAVQSANPFIYVAIAKGEMFGNTDYLRTQADKVGKHKRKFSVLAVDNCETIKLGLDHLAGIKEQFPDIYDQIFEGIDTKFKRITSLKRRALRIILQEDSDQKITDKNGKEIGIQEYKEKDKKNDAIQDAIDMNNLDDLSFSQSSMYSDVVEDNKDSGKASFKGLVGKILSQKFSSEGKEGRILRLEAKMNQLDARLDKIRGQIKNDMREMLQEFMGPRKDTEDENEVDQSEDVNEESQ